MIYIKYTRFCKINHHLELPGYPDPLNAIPIMWSFLGLNLFYVWNMYFWQTHFNIIRRFKFKFNFILIIWILHKTCRIEVKLYLMLSIKKWLITISWIWLFASGSFEICFLSCFFKMFSDIFEFILLFLILLLNESNKNSWTLPCSSLSFAFFLEISCLSKELS